MAGLEGAKTRLPPTCPVAGNNAWHWVAPSSTTRRWSFLMNQPLEWTRSAGASSGG